MADIELPPRLHVDGPRLIKPNGHEWIGRGVSFGTFWHDTPLDVPDVVAMGSNVVRIGLRWWGDHGSNGGKPPVDSRDNDAYSFIHRDHYRNWLDLCMTASAAGLWVVPFIDSNCGQSGRNNPEAIAYCDPNSLFGAHGRNFWTDKPMRKMFATVWQTAAQSLRALPRVAMLEIQPEPQGGDGTAFAGPCRDFYRYMADAIREADPDTPFLSGAREGYEITLCEEALLPEREDFVYTGNLLSQWVNNPSRFDSGLAGLLAMRDTHSVPVWGQQVGRKTADDPTLGNMRHALESMERAGFGFAWWAWKQNTSDPGTYGLNFRNPADSGWTAKTEEQALLAEFMGGNGTRGTPECATSPKGKRRR